MRYWRHAKALGVNMCILTMTGSILSSSIALRSLYLLLSRAFTVIDILLGNTTNNKYPTVANLPVAVVQSQN